MITQSAGRAEGVFNGAAERPNLQQAAIAARNSHQFTDAIELAVASRIGTREHVDDADFLARAALEAVLWRVPHADPNAVVAAVLQQFTARNLGLSDSCKHNLPLYAYTACAEAPTTGEPSGQPEPEEPIIEDLARDLLADESRTFETSGDLARALIDAAPRLTAEDAAEIAVYAFRDAGRPVLEGALVEASRAATARLWADADAAWDAEAPEREAGALARRRAAIIAKAPATPGGAETAREPVRRNTNGVLDLRPRLRSVEFAPGIAIAPPSWLVKGLVPKSGLSLLYGESAAGKTFLSIHLALCTAWGLPAFGRRVRQSGVVYVAAESGSGVLVRLKAAEEALAPAIAAENSARKSQGLPALQRAPIHVITEAPDLGPNGEPKALIATIEDAKARTAATGHALGLAIIDTWHAALGGGDDNSSADTGGALRPLRELCDLHSLATLIVHHPGKDSEKGARGSSALPAAADAIIALVVDGHTGPKAKPSSATRRLTVTKMRDGECGIEASYRLTVVELGRDDDGDPWTTCVVDPVSNAQQAEPGAARLSGQARELMALLRGLADQEGRVNLDAARQRFSAAFKEGRPDAAESAPRMAWGRATKALQDAGRVEVAEEENRIQILDPAP